MARLLRDKDYTDRINSDASLEVIFNKQQAVLDCEQAGQAEMIGYLKQRYLVNEIFTDTTEYDNTVVYYGKNLVEYTAPAFSASTIYTTGQRVVYNSNIYNSTAGSAAHAFNSSEWTLVCADKALFYLTLPENEFSYETSYIAGSEVWFNDHTYTALQPVLNVVPTNTQYWTDNGVYSVVGHKPDDTDYWTAGDNRNQQIVLFLIDITIYHLLSIGINPRNIPDIRKERYNGNSQTDSGGAIGWLKAVAKGNVMADLPEIAPQQGLSMQSGNAGTYDNPSPNMMW